MNINIVKLTSLQTNSDFINQINKKLVENNLFLAEGVENSPLTLFVIESGGTESMFINTIKNYKEPYYIIPLNESNALAATMEICTYLNKENLKHEVLLPGDDLIYNIVTLCSSYYVKNKIKNARLGVIGAPSGWLVGSNIDEKVCKERLGITLVGISLDELYRYLRKPTNITYPNNYQEMAKKNPFDDRLLFESMLVYNGLKKIKEKYNLDGLTIRCFDLIKRFKVSACLALALLNDEGIIAACEGDIPALITMYISSVALKSPSFMCNLSSLNDEDNTYTFAHCTIPFKMINGFEIMSHYETNESLAIRGKMYKGNITLLKCAPDLSALRVINGEILDNLTSPFACRTQIKVKLDTTKEEFIDNKYANHNIIVYGNYRNFFEKLYEILLLN